jgi:hypothetical protein
VTEKDYFYGITEDLKRFERYYWWRVLAVFLLAVALGLVLVPLASAQTSVTVFGLSKHSESGYCEVNPGLGLNYEASEDLRISAGRYLNSKCRWSNAIGGMYTPLHYGEWSFGVALLRLTGYREKAVFAALPIGAYRLTQSSYVDFFFVKNDDLMVAGAAARFLW